MMPLTACGARGQHIRRGLVWGGDGAAFGGSGQSYCRASGVAGGNQDASEAGLPAAWRRTHGELCSSFREPQPRHLLYQPLRPQGEMAGHLRGLDLDWRARAQNIRGPLERRSVFLYTSLWIG